MLSIKLLFKKVSHIIFLLFLSLRPTTWLRFWAEMIVAAALAGREDFNFSHFFLGFLSLGPFLWGAAYIVNDLTDIVLDRQHRLKHLRPIASGKLDKKTAKLAVFILLLFSVGIGLKINIYFLLVIFSLILSQILYTFPAFRLKEKFGLDILINSINSALKFTGAYLTQTAIIDPKRFPFLPLLFFVGIKIIFFVGHRLQSRQLEEKNKIKSTITQLSVKTLKIIILFLILLTSILFFFSIKADYFPRISLFISLVITCLSLPIFYIFIKRNLATNMETNLNFRVVLYSIYFVFSNWLSFAIIHFQ